MRKVLIVTITTAIGTALLSCTAPPPPVAYAPSAPPIVYEPLAPVVHAPLPPPVGYASPPPLMINSPPPLAADGNSAYARSEPPTAAHMVWHASPRWAAVKGKDRTLVKQDPQAKFKAAQAKAAKVGVENLSKEDLDGLNLAQLKELRGY
jgi:hypothetical protein